MAWNLRMMWCLSSNDTLCGGICVVELLDASTVGHSGLVRCNSRVRRLKWRKIKRNFLRQIVFVDVFALEKLKCPPSIWSVHVTACRTKTRHCVQSRISIPWLYCDTRQIFTEPLLMVRDKKRERRNVLRVNNHQHSRAEWKSKRLQVIDNSWQSSIEIFESFVSLGNKRIVLRLSIKYWSGTLFRASHSKLFAFFAVVVFVHFRCVLFSCCVQVCG